MASEQLTNWEVFDWLQKKKTVRDLTSKAQPQQGPSLTSPAVHARQRELKWIDHKVTKFLSSTPAAAQSALSLGSLLALLDNKSAEWGIAFTQKQRMQLLNTQPRKALDLFLCMDDCPELDEVKQGELAAEIALLAAEQASKSASAFAAAAAAAAAAVKPEIVRKRDRSDSSASLAMSRPDSASLTRATVTSKISSVVVSSGLVASSESVLITEAVTESLQLPATGAADGPVVKSRLGKPRIKH
jgi:hypothetical protein